MRQNLRQIKRSKHDPTMSPLCLKLLIMFIKHITYTARFALYIKLIAIDSKGRVIGRNATTKEMISITNSELSIYV
jgi:hypothetical protein